MADVPLWFHLALLYIILTPFSVVGLVLSAIDRDWFGVFACGLHVATSAKLLFL